MNSQETEKLLLKYFNGETDLQEEARLKDFFKFNDVPEHLKSLKGYFNYLDDEKNEEYLGKDFDKTILDKIEDDNKKSKRNTRKLYMYITTAVAASIIILLGVFTSFDRAVSNIKDTYSDPAVAYQEAKNALFVFSTKFNSGLQPAKQLTKLEEGFEEASKLSTFEQGFLQAKKISKIYETQKEIFNQ